MGYTRHRPEDVVQRRAFGHPEGLLPPAGAEITAIRRVPQVCLPFTAQTVDVNRPRRSRCEDGTPPSAACQLFAWFATHDRGLSLLHYSDRSASCLAKRAPAKREKISMKMFFAATLSLLLWSTAGDVSCLGGTVSSHLPKSFLL